MTESIEARKLVAIRTFLKQVNIERRFRILEAAAKKYGMADASAYYDRVRRCTISDIEIADILEAAARDGITPETLKEAKKQAEQLIDRI